MNANDSEGLARALFDGGRRRPAPLRSADRPAPRRQPHGRAPDRLPAGRPAAPASDVPVPLRRQGRNAAAAPGLSRDDGLSFAGRLLPAHSAGRRLGPGQHHRHPAARPAADAGPDHRARRSGTARGPGPPARGGGRAAPRAVLGFRLSLERPHRRRRPVGISLPVAGGRAAHGAAAGLLPGRPGALGRCRPSGRSAAVAAGSGPAPRRPGRPGGIPHRPAGRRRPLGARQRPGQPTSQG